ncbi:MAG: protein kinase [Myxococcota bacterium]
MTQSLPVRVGRYELLRSLGRGGMGEVFEAILTGPAGFHKRVAVKRVFGRDRESTAALEREARFGGLLGHPNVVTVWDLVPTPTGWWVAMELVDGPTLRQLREAGDVSGALLVDVGIQVADGLAHIHELVVDGRAVGLVHRDVKPSNVLVDPSGVVKLTDLGIAALVGSDSERAGTPGYAAPEQLEGRAEPRSDVFSLGAVLAWLCLGRAPFGTGAQGLAEVRRPELALRTSGTLERLELALPGLGAVVARCLRADPELRWGSARALGEALRSLRARATGEALGARVGRWHRTAPTWVPPEPAGEARAPLVGRAAERRELVATLSDPGVYAIRGPPGVGKTRLVEELVAATPAAAIVCLDGVRTERELLDEVTRALGLRVESDPVEHIGVALGVRRVSLLVLDPADGVADDVAALAARWVELAPELRIAVVARRRIPGVEREWVVPPLSAADSAALFSERAGRAVADLDPAAIRALVDALDGLPLAIEVAASRAEWVPLQRLTEGARAGSVLHAVLSTATDELEPAARAALSQLTVFSGGWTLEAAERVIDRPDGRWALELLDALAAHSLIAVDAQGRFRMLEPVRSFASDKLVDRERFELRHGEAFARLWNVVDPFRPTPCRGAEQRLIDAERGNLRIAAERALARGDAEVAGACAATLGSSRQWTQPFDTELELVTRAIALPSRHRATLEIVAGMLCANAGDHPIAAEHLARAGAIAREEHQAGHALWADLLAAETQRVSGRFAEAEANGAGLLEQAERLGHDPLTAKAAFELGAIHRNAGRRAEAEASIRRCIELYQRSRSRRGEASATNTLATLLATGGSPEAANKVRRGALALAREDGDTLLEAAIETNLGLDALELGPPRHAIPHLRAAILVYRRTGALASLLLTLGNLGHVLFEHGELDGAAVVLDEACDLAERHPRGRRMWAANLAFANRAQLDLYVLGLRPAGPAGGDLARVAATIDATIAAEREAGDLRAVANLRCLRSAVPAEGDLAHVEAALDWATTHADVQIEGVARLARAAVWLRRGSPDRAAEDAAHAIPRLASTSRPIARVVLAHAALARGDRATATALVDRAAAEVAALELLPGARASRAVRQARRELTPGSSG